MAYNCPQKEWLNNFSLNEEYTSTEVLWQWNIRKCIHYENIFIRQSKKCGTHISNICIIKTKRMTK